MLRRRKLSCRRIAATTLILATLSLALPASAVSATRTYSAVNLHCGIATFKLVGLKSATVRAARVTLGQRRARVKPAVVSRAARRGTLRLRLSTLRWTSLRTRTHTRRTANRRRAERHGKRARRDKHTGCGNTRAQQAQVRRRTRPKLTVIISDPPDSTDPAPTPPPPPAPLSPIPEPGPVVGIGYHETFGDDFDTLDRTTWCSHQWWEANPPLGSQTVANGELRLRRERSTGYADTTMTTEPCGQANPRSYQYGYFEARMRHETVQGNGPAFWLFSTRHATNDDWPAINSACAEKGLPTIQCVSAELDVFEGFGKINYGGTRTDDFFSGTLHRNSCGCYGVANQSRFVQRGTGLDMSQWHTYAARWTPTQITYYIDGVAQGSVAPFDSTPQPMHLLLYNWNTGWEDENMPTSTTENELDVFVDWVRVWQQ
jgi:hypothetical protein